MLLIIILVWSSPQTDPKTRIQMQVSYLGGDSRKHSGSREVTYKVRKAVGTQDPLRGCVEQHCPSEVQGSWSVYPLTLVPHWLRVISGVCQVPCTLVSLIHTDYTLIVQECFHEDIGSCYLYRNLLQMTARMGQGVLGWALTVSATTINLFVTAYGLLSCQIIIVGSHHGWKNFKTYYSFYLFPTLSKCIFCM